jgi:hypothetical protein
VESLVRIINIVRRFSMKRLYSIFIIAVIIILGASCTEIDTKAPNVVETFPVSGSTDVDPSLSEITVTFDEAMKDGNWSWAYADKNKFPEMTGQPYYRPGHKINVLPVKLEANKEYEIWINSEKFKNFKDQSGNPATPFRLIFRTK